MADWEDALREPCVLWPGGKTGNNYGVITYQTGYQIHAHRYAFLFTFGFLPNGLCICHRCDTTLCINPFHLFAGTQKDNIADMHRKNRDKHRGSKGSDNNTSIYSAEQVLEMRRMFAAGIRVCEINKKFGGAYQSVWLIVRRRNWSHI